jgi:hypothetical protein
MQSESSRSMAKSTLKRSTDSLQDTSRTVVESSKTMVGQYSLQINIDSSKGFGKVKNGNRVRSIQHGGCDAVCFTGAFDKALPG